MRLDPDSEALLEAARAANRPAWNELTPEEAREVYLAGRTLSAPPPMQVAEVRDLTCPGPHGAIPLRLYRPAAAPALGAPVLVYAHGGGWVFGSLDSHDGLCRHLAVRSGCVVVAVDYRLAPEHRFPAAFDDTLAATQWVAAQEEALGINPARLAVGGDSAGGTLMAAVCLHARDHGGPRIAFQLLLYPTTDLAMDTPSHRRFGEGHVLTTAAMRWFSELYLRGPEDAADWRAAPLRAASLAGLPPAFVLTASHDPLRDEGEAHARRLVEEAGVPVTLWRVAGQLHGFLPMGRLLRAAGPALDQLAAALRQALSPQA
jgi:acetyl esterase